MPDRHTTVTRTGYFGNLRNAVIGVLIGLALFLGAFWVLAWNEGDTVAVLGSVAWTEERLVVADAARVDPAQDGQPVYVAGEARALEGRLVDDETGFAAATGALRLRRVVEMYQWKEDKRTESRDTPGGGTETRTTYTYTTGWHEGRIDSARFDREAGHRNPPLSLPAETWTASAARLGAFPLSEAALDRLPLERVTRPEGGRDWPGQAEYLYQDGRGRANPEVGDVRVRYDLAPAGPLAVIAQQGTGGELGPVATPGSYDPLLVSRASPLPDAAALFQAERDRVDAVTWLARGGGFLMMLIGVQLLLGPLKALVGFIPFARGVVGFGIFLVALAIAVPLTLVTIALAWLAFRPLLSAALILGGLAVTGIVLALVRRTRAPEPEAAAA